jgi:hypothetical protein
VNEKTKQILKKLKFIYKPTVVVVVVVVVDVVVVVLTVVGIVVFVDCPPIPGNVDEKFPTTCTVDVDELFIFEFIVVDVAVVLD